MITFIRSFQHLNLKDFFFLFNVGIPVVMGQNKCHLFQEIGSKEKVQFIQSFSHIWLCNSMKCNTPGLPVYHQLPDFTQIHVQWVSDAIQPSHPLLSPSPPALNHPASGSFQMSQLFTSGGQNIGVPASTSVLPMNIQDWSPLEYTRWISLQSKGLSRVFSNTTVQKHQFFGAQLSL